MSLLVILTGPRACGKTTTAMKMAGKDPWIQRGYDLAKIPELLNDAPADRNWILSDAIMTRADVALLQQIALDGKYRATKPNGGEYDRLAPELIVVDVTHIAL